MQNYGLCLHVLTQMFDKTYTPFNIQQRNSHTSANITIIEVMIINLDALAY